MSLSLSTVSASARRAFSLVEVLVAVFVLALGLLGLGAVFPAVLRQQRIATQTTQGINAQNAIAPILASNSNFRPGGRGWDALKQYIRNEGNDSGDWIAVEPYDATPSDVELLGTYILPDPNDPINPVYLPLAQRLYPLPLTTGEDPKFVWDIAARLIDPDNPDTSQLRVAIFLRSIDAGIKPNFRNGSTEPTRYTLTSTLIGDPNDPGKPALKHRRHPISVDKSGSPTLDGRRGPRWRYATPIVADIIGPGTESGPRNLLVINAVLSPQTDESVATLLLATPGQRFLDSRGHIYTVTKINKIADQARTIKFDPPIIEEDTNQDFTFDNDDFNPIIFLPKSTPVAPHVFTVDF